MFRATLLKSRSQAGIQPGSSSSSRKSRMLQRRATRQRRLNPSLPATEPVEVDSMEALADENIPVAPAIADIDVVDVAPDLPALLKSIQRADMLPIVPVATAEAISVESIVSVPDMAPADFQAAPLLALAGETIVTLPAMTADVEPKVGGAAIIAAAPTIVTIAPADSVTTGALPATPKTVKKPQKKREHAGLGSVAGKPTRTRRKSVKHSGAGGAADLTEGRLPGYGLDDISGAYSLL